MKKILLVIVVIMGQVVGKTQGKLFVNFYGGYGFFSPGSYRVQSTNSISYRDQNNNFRDTLIQTQGNKGIGGGFRFGGGLGYVLNDFLNVGIDIEFQKGTKLTNGLSTSISQYNFNSSYDEMHYKAITISPFAIFKALAKPNYFIYNKLGVLFTLPYSLYTAGNTASSDGYHWPVTPTDSAISQLTTQHKNYEGNYKLSLGLGFNVAFGVNMRLTNKLRLFTELFGNFSALVPARSTILTESNYKYSHYEATDYDYTTNPPTPRYYQPGGYEQNYSTTVNTDYQKEGPPSTVQVYSDWTPGNPSQTNELYKAKDSRFTVNMNSIGINCGIAYRF